MLVVPVSEREFNLYALALHQGPNFEPYVVVSGWKCDKSMSVGGVLLNHDTRDFELAEAAQNGLQVRSSIGVRRNALGTNATRF